MTSQSSGFLSPDAARAAVAGAQASVADLAVWLRS